MPISDPNNPQTSRYTIYDLATAMLGHATAGNMERAEELALEIERAQAELGSRAFIPSPEQNREPWLVDLKVWAKVLWRAHLVERRVWPASPATPQSACGEAHRVHLSTVRPEHLTPEFPYTQRILEAAE